MQAPAGDPNSRSDRSTDRKRPGLGSRRIAWTSFAVSLLLHVIGIALYPSYVRDLDSDAAPTRPADLVDQDGFDVVRLMEFDVTPDSERPDDPDEIEELDSPAAVPTIVDIGGAPTVSLVPPGPSGAELLRPRFRNRRLWAPLDRRIVDLSLEQREELLVAGRLEVWFDSVEAALAAEAALTDWTFTDKNGKKWGISPGKIHLGDITLPLPLNFGVPVGKRDEVAQRKWQWEELMRQGARAEIEEAWAERQSAIRERRDRERAAARPDTTRGRR